MKKEVEKIRLRVFFIAWKLENRSVRRKQAKKILKNRKIGFWREVFHKHSSGRIRNRFIIVLSYKTIVGFHLWAKKSPKRRIKRRSLNKLILSLLVRPAKNQLTGRIKFNYYIRLSYHGTQTITRIQTMSHAQLVRYSHSLIRHSPNASEHKNDCSWVNSRQSFSTHLRMAHC